jgi:hypothetical protein
MYVQAVQVSLFQDGMSGDSGGHFGSRTMATGGKETTPEEVAYFYTADNFADMKELD